jgi:DNA-binding NtrC family response regulator
MPIRVVVVRPDRPAHTLIAAAFEMSGCEVHCASDIRAAWTLVVQKKPQILLLEYPEQLDGALELLHRVEPLRARGTTIATEVSNALSPEATATVAVCSDLCYRMPTPPADVVRAVLQHAASRAASPPASGASDDPVEPDAPRTQPAG